MPNSDSLGISSVSFSIADINSNFKYHHLGMRISSSSIAISTVVPGIDCDAAQTILVRQPLGHCASAVPTGTKGHYGAKVQVPRERHHIIQRGMQPASNPAALDQALLNSQN